MLSAGLNKKQKNFKKILTNRGKTYIIINVADEQHTIAAGNEGV